MTEIPHYLQKHIFHLLDRTNTCCLKIVNKYGFLSDYMINSLHEDIISCLKSQPNIKISKIYIDINSGTRIRLLYNDIMVSNLRKLLLFLISESHPIRTLFLGFEPIISEEDMMIISKNIPTLISFKADFKMCLSDSMTSILTSMINLNPNWRTLYINPGNDENNNYLKVVETLLSHPNVKKMIIDSSMFHDVETLDKACEMISQCKRIDNIKFFFQLGDRNDVLKRMDKHWIKYFMVDCLHIKSMSIQYNPTIETLTKMGLMPAIIEYLRYNTHIRKLTFDAEYDSNHLTRGYILRALKDCNFCLELFDCQFYYYDNNLHDFESFLYRNRSNNLAKDTTLFQMMYKNIHLYTFFEKTKNNKKQRVH